MGEPVDRVADHVDVLQVREPGPEPVDEVSLAGAHLVPLGDDGLQRRGGRQRRRDVLEPRHPGVGPVVGRERRPPPGALADEQHPHAGRPAPLVGGRGGGGPPARQVDPPGRGRRVREDGHPVPVRDARHLARTAAGCPPRGSRPGRPRRPPAPARTARVASRAATSTCPWASTGTPSVVPAKWRTHQAPADSTAECSTAVCTSRPLVRRRPSSSPRTPRCTACVPDPVKLTSSGRAPSSEATTSRALSSSSRASRPAPCSRSGSAKPRSRAASRASRAAGCSGSVDTASR